MADKDFLTGEHIIEISNGDFFSGVESMLREGRSVRMPVKGTSMIPFIVEGRDEVEAGPVSGELRRRDIVLARTDRGIVMHRIYRISGCGSDARFTLMGDGNLYMTETCPACDVIGKANAIFRKGRRVDTGGKCERLKAWIWMSLRPARRFLIPVWKFFHRSRIH
ncbi:MAG: S24/S26 family peptidase [Candidatus Cryptobacteroides sp.]